MAKKSHPAPRPPRPKSCQMRKRAICTPMPMPSVRLSSKRGASESFGVTRYQWARIIAANEPPVTAARIKSCSESATATSGVGAQPTAATSSAATAVTTVTRPTWRPSLPRAMRSVQSVARQATRTSRRRRSASISGVAAWIGASADGIGSAPSASQARKAQPPAAKTVKPR